MPTVAEAEKPKEQMKLERRPYVPAPSSPLFIRRLTDEMERFFDDLSFGASWFRPRLWKEFGFSQAMWAPEIEMVERDKKLVVRVDLPGIKKEYVKVEVTPNDELVIRGERRDEHEEKREGFYRTERRYGRFYRSVPLPEGTDVDQATAHFRDGVLEVELPAPAQPTRGQRAIEVHG
jgi:HSP20 family protein